MNAATVGLMAEFKTHEELLAAARQAYATGYRRMDGFAPFPVEGLPEALGHRRSAIPLIVLASGMAGGLGGYFMQWYACTISYPIDVGGRPLHSWPSFIPITFELTVLGAALAALISMLLLNQLPRLNHPVFNVPAFARASTDRFFLCIDADDPMYNPVATKSFLERLLPLSIAEVPA